MKYHQIKQYTVGLVLERQCDRLFGISRVKDLIGVFKTIAEKTSHGFIVVDNQDSRHDCHLLSFHPGPWTTDLMLLGYPEDLAHLVGQSCMGERLLKECDPGI